ncbi:MAG TPA: nicotinamide-nucleotide amidohydrolase family protein [Gammaproteobacteria bacterium]|nr:nicotinamide-nucleotide amidohydrolase family protein [Gammaproteobacteria bacterium]
MTTDSVSDAALQKLSLQVGEALLARRLTLACAESCTGGWVAKSLTDIAGCLRWFDRGFVTYTKRAKEDMLGLDGTLLERCGVVSEEVVRAMAEGALNHSQASVTLAISGIAGPGGGSKDLPVGLVWFAWLRKIETGRLQRLSRQQIFAGDREAVRRQAVAGALQGVLAILNEQS